LALHLIFNKLGIINRKEAISNPYKVITLVATLIVFLPLACSPSSHINSSLGPLLLGPGTHVGSIEFSGLTRTYRVHVPPSFDKSKPTPLVLAFHGGGGTGAAMAKLSNLDDVSDRERFIVVYPDGIGRSWNAGHGTGAAERRDIDDVGFISKLIEVLARDFHIDGQRVYATGMSNGAMFAHRLACELSDKIAAIAPVAGTIPPKIDRDCKPGRPISVMEIHGTADQDSPWDGGRTIGGGQVESVSATIRGWVVRGQCPLTPKVTYPAQGVISETYAPCREGTEVRLYRIEKGGHTWPGGYQYLPRLLIGETNRALNASDAIWDFFEKHPMKEH
jgi:polyhydroxybutyrate depolymerase